MEEWKHESKGCNVMIFFDTETNAYTTSMQP
jgi:hypothetical protein